MSTHTADPAAADHPFEPEWNPTPTNGELTAELGNPFRDELQVDTSLPCSTAIEDMVAAVEQQSQPKPDPLTDGYPVGGPGQITAATPKPAGSVMTDAVMGLAEAVGGSGSGKSNAAALLAAAQAAGAGISVAVATQEPPEDSQAVSEPLSPSDGATAAEPKLRESARGEAGTGYFEPDEAARVEQAKLKTVDPVGKAKDRVEEREAALQKAQALEDAGAPALAADQREVADRYERKLGHLPTDGSAK